MENNDEFYFDTEELEDIIVYYLELGDFNYADNAVNYGLKLHPNSLDIKIKKLEVLLEWEEYNAAKELIDDEFWCLQDRTVYYVTDFIESAGDFD